MRRSTGVAGHFQAKNLKTAEARNTKVRGSEPKNLAAGQRVTGVNLPVGLALQERPNAAFALENGTVDCGVINRSSNTIDQRLTRSRRLTLGQIVRQSVQ